MFTTVRFTCSSPDCPVETSTHYCLVHGARCTDCGREFSRAELAGGICIDCEPVDEPEFTCAADVEMATHLAWGK